MRYQSIIYVLLLVPAASASTEQEARKVLAARCWSCHAQTAMAGLRLDSREAMLRGGKSGPAVRPGDAVGSRVVQAVSRRVPGVKAMPPGAPLSAAEIETIRRWVADGAPWSDSEATHWSFRPLQPVRAGDSIDRLSKPSGPRADRRTLIRRAYFETTGLPPTDEEFHAAFSDSRADWFERLVSRLLASPHFGEKWGRHWLDVARFGEDDFTGTEVVPYANAWRYRDWVIQAINDDMPYDRFLMAQLAGDLMKDPALLPATGLLGGGPWYYGIAQPAQSRADERHDRVDMVTRGMLGVTVACARCHDHKYDPFTQKDYYALAGVFASTAYKEYPLVPESEAEAWKKQKARITAAEKELNRFLDEQADGLADRFSGRIADYMLGTAPDLNPRVLERWRKYLSKPEENHQFLAKWFGGNKAAEEARAFERLILTVAAEKKALDRQNREQVEAAKKKAPKIVRTIVLPGGYRSEEDFNPGADIPSRSLERDRFVAWNRILGERGAPLKFERELVPELLDPPQRAEYDRKKAVLEAMKKALPPQYAYLHGAGEFEPWDLNLNIRGNPEALGELVPRRFPLALSGGKVLPFDRGSGRLQLAETVASHPLAARVAVNRIWMYLFGEGLVRTPSNFGRTGDRPSQPELLEYLAARFVAHKYSVKAMIREILLSGTWQQVRMARRLDAEPLLDAMLAASGELDRKPGGESKPLNAEFRRRSVYAKTGRFQSDDTLALFDLPSALVTCEQRVVTNVPLQKLFYLNSDLVAARAAALAKRIERPSVNDGLQTAYRLLFQRGPSEREQQLGREFLEREGEDRWKKFAWVLLSSNEFAYVN